MMITNIAHAGIIDDAPSVAELVLNALQALLSFAGALAVLAVIIAGILYMSASGDTDRAVLAKRALVMSITGLVVILLALTIVLQIGKTLG